MSKALRALWPLNPSYPDRCLGCRGLVWCYCHETNSERQLVASDVLERLAAHGPVTITCLPDGSVSVSALEEPDGLTVTAKTLDGVIERIRVAWLPWLEGCADGPPPLP